MEISEANIKSILGCIENLEHDKLEGINADDDLRSLGLDSLTSIELVVKLEEEYSVSIADDDLLIDNVCTINNIEKLLKKYKG